MVAVAVATGVGVGAGVGVGVRVGVGVGVSVGWGVTTMTTGVGVGIADSAAHDVSNATTSADARTVKEWMRRCMVGIISSTNLDNQWQKPHASTESASASSQCCIVGC